MIPTTLRIVLVVGLLVYFIVILYFLKKAALELKYTLLWLAAGVVMSLFVIFPTLLPWLIRTLGFESNMNGLFFIAISFLMLICMTLTSIVSRQMRKINRLVQKIAILENKLSLQDVER